MATGSLALSESYALLCRIQISQNDAREGGASHWVGKVIIFFFRK